MSTNKQALREELSNPAIGTNAHLRKLALALLDELETKEEQRANWFQMAEKLGADLDAAERCIAELEARTVVIHDDLDFDCEFENGEYGIADEPWLRGRVDGFNTGMKLITKAIRAAGITVKGDSE